MTRARSLRIDTEFSNRLAHSRSLDCTAVGQRCQRGDVDIVAMDFEELTQLFAAVTAAPSVRPEGPVVAGYIGPDLFRVIESSLG